MSGTGVDLHPYYQRGTNALPNVSFGWIKMADGAAVYRKQADGKLWTADAHAALFRRLGLPFGGYEFASASTDGGRAFDVLWGECQRLGGTGVAPATDIEGDGWNKTNATARGRSFCSRARARGVRPAIYMDLWLLQACRPDEWPEDPVIWAPRYSGLKPEDGARYTGHYDVHQFSSSGTLPGSAGSVDMNRAYTTAHLIGEDDMPDEATFKTWVSQVIDSKLGAINAGTRDTVRYEVLATPHDPQDPRSFIFGDRNIVDILVELLRQAFAANAKADAVAAALAELATDKDITPEKMQEMLTKAVAESIQVSGQLHIEPISGPDAQATTQAVSQ
ncbi:GH25 family lysozyme [Amycolatopsis plumensis]|uniref:GH25 family lysozyme n=1 Tax=Amycolatopsis plumensis TaxID=236508 RepID=A0ABV5U8I9_9PSEU